MKMTECKSVSVLKFTETRIKLFLIFGKSETRVFRKVVLKKRVVFDIYTSLVVEAAPGIKQNKRGVECLASC